MSGRLAGARVGILMESDFYEHEIWYYSYRFPEEGAELHFLTRLWGQPSLTFTGHEYKAPYVCTESFENMDQLDRDLVALEKDPSSRDILARIFRTIHTIKGTCGFLAFSRLEGSRRWLRL